MSVLTGEERGWTVTVICCTIATKLLLFPEMVLPHKHLRPSLTAQANAWHNAMRFRWVNKSIFIRFLKHFVEVDHKILIIIPAIPRIWILSNMPGTARSLCCPFLCSQHTNYNRLMLVSIAVQAVSNCMAVIFANGVVIFFGQHDAGLF